MEVNATRALMCIKGQRRHRIKKRMPDGSIEITESDWKPNRVVDDAGILIAGLLKKDTSFTDWGILYYAIGEGNASWDTGGTPTPSMSQHILLAEFDRVAPDYVIYMDSLGGSPSVSPTNVIETRATFTFAMGPSPTGKWIREHALFGADATATQDSGTVFNIHNDTKIWKDDTIELELFFQHEVDIVAL